MRVVKQSEIDDAIERFKNHMLEMIGEKHISVALLEDKTIVSELCIYEMVLRKVIHDAGLSAPSVSELFDCNIKITEAKRVLH